MEDAVLKIAYIFPQFPVATQTFAESDIAALLGLGCDVRAYCLKPYDRKTASLASRVPAGIQRSYFRPSHPMKALSAVAKNWRQMAGLAGAVLRNAAASPRTVLSSLVCLPRVAEILEEIRLFSPDVVHAFWGLHPSLVLDLIRRRSPEGGRPLLSVFVGAYDLVRADFLVDMGLAAADIRFTHAEENREFFTRRGFDDVHVIHRGIPLQLVDEAAPAPIPGQILTAAALVPEKNVSGSIEAFGRMARNHPQAVLHIAGSGPSEAALRSLVSALGLKSKVIFHGHLARADLFHLMQRSQIFILLSVKPSERLPNVLKEAMLAGAYVVSSNSVGITELIPSASFGAVVDPANKSAVDRALEQAMGEDPIAANARRAQCKKHIEDSMSDVGSMTKYIRAWQSHIRTAAKD